ncbi:DUF4190 domain-containing protein [Runella sp.]|uniref:DUF4190 domain-containing protein n=1 Tax=Runella sp. TaxID=1960881 RepID=UPI003D0F6579
MKKLFLYLAFLGVSTSFMACHKNNYVTAIPAPHFQYIKTDAKIAQKNREAIQKEQHSDTTEIGSTNTETLVLAANVKNLTSYHTKPYLLKTIASKAATDKLIKARSVSKEASAKKLTLKERVFGKMLTKRIEKMQNGTAPKANKTNTVALLSGIAGLAGLVLLLTSAGAISILLGAVAIIMGFVGKAQIRRTGEAGVGWAITGIVSGIIIFFILLLAVLFIASLLGL